MSFGLMVGLEDPIHLQKPGAPMPALAPPRPPVSVTVDDEGLRRLHFRLWQILMTAITVLLTTWFVTFGVIPAIIALMIAKHVLVAILVLGLDQPKRNCRLQIADCRFEDKAAGIEG